MELTTAKPGNGGPKPAYLNRTKTEPNQDTCTKTDSDSYGAGAKRNEAANSMKTEFQEKNIKKRDKI